MSDYEGKWIVSADGNVYGISSIGLAQTFEEAAAPNWYLDSVDPERITDPAALRAVARRLREIADTLSAPQRPQNG